MTNRDWLNSLDNENAARVICNVMYKVIANHAKGVKIWDDLLYNVLVQNWLDEEYKKQ